LGIFLDIIRNLGEWHRTYLLLWANEKLCCQIRKHFGNN